MDEAKLRTIAQLQEFLDATQEIKFTGAPGESDQKRYEHISRVLKRFAYPGLGKGERRVVLTYLRRTNGYSRAKITCRALRPVDAVKDAPGIKWRRNWFYACTPSSTASSLRGQSHVVSESAEGESEGSAP